jgi:hypothetical protein
MKLHSVLARVAAFLAAVALNAAPLLAIALVAGALLALIAAHDYAPRRHPRLAVGATVLRFNPPAPANEEHRLAA